MDAQYWEKVGSTYGDSIFDSAKMDRRGVVRARLREHADPRANACDFGCGVGHYLPLLAPLFRRVYGFDFAPSLVRQAAERSAAFENVEVSRANLANPRVKLAMPKVRFGICMNVLISDDETRRRRILETAQRHLVRSGRLLLLVPSLESALYSNGRHIEWNRRLGHTQDEALAFGIPPTARSARELVQGLVRIEGVPTKHYLREEAEGMLARCGLPVESVDKVEYGWETEFERPPRWMKALPGPWDWLFVARKR